MPATLNPNDFVFVTLLSNRPGYENLGNGWVETRPDDISKPLTVGWNGRMTDLQVGKKVFVQLEAAVNAFGDPRSAATAQAIPIGDPNSGERLFIPDRTAEVRRLRLRYGILDGNDTGFENVNGTFMAPRVKIETESGEEIISVLDDPEGKTVNPVEVTVQANQDQNALIAHLTRQVEALKVMVEKQNEAGPSDLDDLPDDDDSTSSIPNFASVSDIPESLDELPNDT